MNPTRALWLSLACCAAFAACPLVVAPVPAGVRLEASYVASAPSDVRPAARGPRGLTKKITVTNAAATALAYSATFEQSWGVCNVDPTADVDVYLVEQGASAVTNGQGPYCNACTGGQGATFVIGGFDFARSSSTASGSVRCRFYDSPISSGVAVGGGGGGVSSAVADATYLRLDASNDPVLNTLTVTNFASTGTTTIGNASGDSVVANSAEWSFPNDTTASLGGGVNGLNFGSNTLSLDGTNKRVCVGCTDPAGGVDVVGLNATIQAEDASAGNAVLAAYNYNAVGSAFPAFIMSHARGTRAAPTATQSGDALGVVIWGGFGGSNGDSAVQMSSFATETWTGTANGARWDLRTAPNGQHTPLVRVTVGQNGRVALGTNTAPDARFEIDNGAVAEPIFEAKDNGTTKVRIADGGFLDFTDGTSTAGGTRGLGLISDPTSGFSYGPDTVYGGSAFNAFHVSGGVAAGIDLDDYCVASILDHTASVFREGAGDVLPTAAQDNIYGDSTAHAALLSNNGDAYDPLARRVSALSTGDQTISTATLTDVTGVTLTLQVGSYHCESDAAAQDTTGTDGAKYKVVLSAGSATTQTGVATLISDAGVVTSTATTTGTSVATSVATFATGAAHAEFTLVVNGTGTLKVQAAQNTHAAGGLIVYKGASLVCDRL